MGVYGGTAGTLWLDDLALEPVSTLNVLRRAGMWFAHCLTWYRMMLPRRLLGQMKMLTRRRVTLGISEIRSGGWEPADAAYISTGALLTDAVERAYQLTRELSGDKVYI